MQTFIVFLRGINVSGHKKIKMVDLQEMLKKLNFHNVATYIQSGNIVLKSNEKNTAVIAEKIKNGIVSTFGFNLPVLVKTHTALKAILNQNPFTKPADIENKRIYFALLEATPKPDLVIEFKKNTFVNEQFLLIDNCVYLNYLNGAGKAKLTNNLIERKLKVTATSRNYSTMTKLLAMSVAVAALKE